FKALTRRALRYRLRLGKRLAAIRRSDDECMPVIFVIAGRIRDDETAVGTDCNLGPCVGTVVDGKLCRRQCQSHRVRLGEIGRTCNRETIACDPGDPEFAVRRKGWRDDPGTDERGLVTCCDRW